MLKLINHLSLITVLIIAALNSQAQDRIGSPYTRYGLGDLVTQNFGDSRSMGGTSLGLRNTSKIYVDNPASYSAIDSLHFVMEVGISAAMKRMSSGSNEISTNLYDVNFDYLSFGFPVTEWWGAAFGVLPYSNVSYDIVTSETNMDLTRDYHYKGAGGINQAFVGSSFQPIENLSLGINLNYLFGNIQQVNSMQFTGSSEEGMLDITEKKTMYLNNFYFSLGTQYDYQLTDNQRLTIGLTCDLNTTINAHRTYLATNALSATSDVVADTVEHNPREEGEIKLPLNIGAGMAYHYKDVLSLAADLRYQDWSNATIFGEQDSLGAGRRISLGAEYTPSGKESPDLKYMHNIRYRLGAYYNDTYLVFDQGDTQINDFGISFGLGLPLKRSNTTFNLSLELGQRGSLKNDLVKEEYVVLGINFSLSDIWFIKRKFE
ncbi:MAG: hypothetical protein ACQES1_05550 [Bacteroidota bacterium]